MATPVGRRGCGRIETSFLDNITAKVGDEAEEEGEEGGREGERKRGNEPSGKCVTVSVSLM